MSNAIPGRPLLIAALALAVPFACASFVDAIRPDSSVRLALAAVCLVAGLAGAVTGAILAIRQNSTSGTLRRWLCAAVILMCVAAVPAALFAAGAVLLAGARFN